MIPATTSKKSAKVYTVPAAPVFRVETKDDYVFIDKWFTQLGKDTDEWLKNINTVRAFDRIQPLIKTPVLMAVDKPTTKADEKHPDERVAVNKYIISIVLDWLDNDTLRQLVADKMPINILVSSRCESLHIRTTDGWYSISQVAEHLKFDVADFVKSEQMKTLINTFGPVATANQSIRGGKEKTVWGHPVVLVPMLLWINSTAALELMASYFMTDASLMPNIDAMVPLIEKNIKIRAAVKAKQALAEEKVVAEEKTS
jgi:hypothetical protein